MEKKAITGFLLLGLLSATLSTQRAAAAAAFSPAVYVFGDSLVDVGNNNFLPGSPQANLLPYGIDFPGRVPTGRFTSGLISVDFSNTQAIYDHGGRKFAILGTARIGCVPGMRVLMPSGGCNEDLNDLSLRFRAAVKALLEELSATLDGFKYSYTDLNEINNDIAADPHKYGLTELQAACCGSGILNAEGPCTPNATYCGDRSRYFFWDGTHPTETVYRAVAQLSLYGRPPFVYPVNIHRLLKS